MGYKIPRPDYTRPPANFNVAADIGRSIASGIAQYSVYRRQQQAEAQKLAQAELEFKNTLLINQAKTLGTFDKQAAEKFGQETEMFKQFQGIVRDKAKNAMAASVAMQFDKNLTDEQRAEYAQVVADFDTYTASSMEQLGGVVADYNAFADPVQMKNQVVIGNPMNGERFFNEVTLTNLGGNGPAALNVSGENFTRTVEAVGTNNIITSQVKLPKNHPSVVKHKEYIEKGLSEGGKYTYGTIKEEDGMYVFTSKINAGAYGTKEGFDFVQEVRQPVNGSKLMRDVNFLTEDGGITDGNMYQDTYITSGELMTDEGKSTGKIETVTREIVNISGLTDNPAFQAELSSEYAAVFGPTQSIAQQAAYIERNLGIVDLPAGFNKYKNLEDFLMKGSEQEKEDFVKLALQTEILEKSFPQTKRKQYTDPKTTVQPAEGDLLAFLNRNNYLNEFGQPYQKGDNVYMIETMDLRNKPQQSTSTSSDTEQRFNDWYDDPTSITQISLPNSDRQVTYNAATGKWTISFRGTEQPGQDIKPPVELDTEADIKRYLKPYTSY